MKHCKFYRPKEKDIESDLLYVRLDKKNCLHYVYPDRFSASSAYSIMTNKKYPRYFARSLKAIELSSNKSVKYVVLKHKDAIVDCPSNTSPSILRFSEKECEKLSKMGVWREVSEEEAVLL